MDGCILDEESNNLNADASFKGGFYGSAHVQAMTLGYILKTNWQVKLHFWNIYT